MCDRAFLAARRIKGQYGTHFAAYDDTLRNKLLREQAITDGMEAALKTGSLKYICSPNTGSRMISLAGAEALVRWNHPEWGLQSPAEFIPLFERTALSPGWINMSGNRACAELHNGTKKGSAHFGLRQCVPGGYLQRGFAGILTRNREKI